MIRRGASGLTTLLLTAVVLAAATWLLPGLLGYDRYVITGGSMSGSIEKGSIVFTRAVPVEELKVGDVITYLPPPESGVGTLVTHRIVSVRDDSAGHLALRTQGDANPDPDPWRFSLTATHQPVVVHDLPLAGHVLIALADRGTRQLVIGLPAVLVALAGLLELVRTLRRSEAAAAAVEG